jgi:hypothetical protein
VTRSGEKEAPSSPKFRSSVAAVEVDLQRDPPSGLGQGRDECEGGGEGGGVPEDSILFVESDESGGEEEVNVEEDDEGAEQPEELWAMLAV